MGTQKLTMNTNWKRLNIAENKKELRIDRKVSFPSNLYLERRTNTPNLVCFLVTKRRGLKKLIIDKNFSENDIYQERGRDKYINLC